jgi:non-canonical (house-cleaning) NTP pyrophosphatase
LYASKKMKKLYFLINSNSKLKKIAVFEVLNNYFSNKNFEIKQKFCNIKFPKTPKNNLTFLGAKKRAKALEKNIKDKDNLVFIGLESGLVKRYGFWFEECWCFLIYIKKYYLGYSSGFLLPKNIVLKMNKKPHYKILKELEKESKIHSKDTWAHYSKNRLSRKESIKEAFRNAFLSLINDLE